MERVLELMVVLEPADGEDAEAVEQAAIQLRDELLELEVEDVQSVGAGRPPAGTRAVDVALLGAMVVSLAQSSGLLNAVVTTVQAWLGRLADRSVKISLDGDMLELTHISSLEQQELIRAWVARHGGGGKAG